MALETVECRSAADLVALFASGTVAKISAASFLANNVIESWTLEYLAQRAPSAPCAQQPDIPDLEAALAAQGRPVERPPLPLRTLHASIERTRARPTSPFDQHPFIDEVLTGEADDRVQSCLHELVDNPVDGRLCVTQLGADLEAELKVTAVLSPWRSMINMLWIGASNPVPCRPLHADGMDNILVQLRGTKRLIVYPAAVSHQFPRPPIHGDAFCFHPAGAARRGPWHIDCLEQHGELATVPYYETILRPGDAVTIPACAMHAAFGSLDSLSVNAFLLFGPLPAERWAFARACLQMGVVFPLRRAFGQPAAVSSYTVRRRSVSSRLARSARDT